MPIIDGEETFRELRNVRHDVTVILSSGYSEQDAVNRFGENGLAGFIQKPFTTQDLMLKVNEVLDQRAAPDA